MSEEKAQTGLKGWVLVGRTVNLGKFNSVKLELGSEFLIEEHPNHLDLAEVLYTKIESFQEKHGLRQHLD